MSNKIHPYIITLNNSGKFHKTQYLIKIYKLEIIQKQISNNIYY